jgi:hypothetical protein
VSGIFLAAAASGAVNYAPIYTGTLGSTQFGNFFGYIPSVAGSLSPTTFVFGGGPTITITSVVDVIAPTAQSYIVMSGFTSDPGFAALYSFQWKGGAEVIYTRGLTGYTYTPGSPNTAQWTFSSGSVVFGLVGGVGTSGSLVLKG